jgi:hypothetical protein
MGEVGRRPVVTETGGHDDMYPSSSIILVMKPRQVLWAWHVAGEVRQGFGGEI